MFRLCAEGRAILRGLERSDSVVLDPHKGLFLPFGLGAVMVREAAAMRAAFTFDASYIPERGRGAEAVSPAEYSLELTRPFRALRLWLPLQVLGTGPFEAALEEKILLARYAHERFHELPGIEVGPEPDLSLFVFRALPRRGDPDDFTSRLEQSLREDGRVGLSPTVLNGSRFLRFAVLSVRTHREAVDQAIEVIREKVDALAGL
jgi:aromatic-L-amino-acid/L-tryptophan decarboxylase